MVKMHVETTLLLTRQNRFASTIITKQISDEKGKIMILVTGATGHLGTAVIRRLLKKTSANQIAALVRDESRAADLKEKGVNICVGNYDDTASLDKAMQGIEKVLLIAGTDEENRIRQHQNVVNSAKKLGVKFIGYTSRNLKDRNTLVNKLMGGHFQTEDYIIENGLNYAIFRNVLYLDTIPQFVGGEKVFETGIKLPGYAAYAAMKGAIETLTKYQAKELGARKIRVNVVAPGAIETDFGGGAVRDNKQLNNFVASVTALGRTGMPEDIGGVVAFLCTEEARWINAQRIEVSGGMML